MVGAQSSFAAHDLTGVSEHENKRDLLDKKGNTINWYPKQLCAESATSSLIIECDI